MNKNVKYDVFLPTGQLLETVYASFKINILTVKRQLIDDGFSPDIILQRK